MPAAPNVANEVPDEGRASFEPVDAPGRYPRRERKEDKIPAAAAPRKDGVTTRKERIDPGDAPRRNRSRSPRRERKESNIPAAALEPVDVPRRNRTRSQRPEANR